ncbi:MAG: sugar nucleotide-binding protein [Eubacteriales bacterium]|nr:sugar nucleotide-binding protein [Eubacteriales bacterium]
MRLLVTGAGGFLGSRLLAYYRQRYEVWGPSHRELELTDGEGVLRALEAWRPKVVLHCGAISDVAACSADPAGSYRINVDGAYHVAKACARVGARLVFCSSDQVYFRREEPASANDREAFALRQNRESDPVCPVPVYGKQKLAAEELLREVCPDSVSLRLSWMYDALTESEKNRGRRNLGTMLLDALETGEGLTFSDTDYRSVTDASRVVRWMETAWQLPAGVYNFGSGSRQSMYRTARQVLAAFGREELVRKGGDNSLRNLTMDAGKLEKNGICFPETAEGLIDFLREQSG